MSQPEQVPEVITTQPLMEEQKRPGQENPVRAVPQKKEPSCCTQCCRSDDTGSCVLECLDCLDAFLDMCVIFITCRDFGNCGDCGDCCSCDNCGDCGDCGDCDCGGCGDCDCSGCDCDCSN